MARTARRVDALGLALVVAAVAWTFVAAAANDGSRPWPYTAALVAVAGGVAAGRSIGRGIGPSSAPTAVGVLAGVLLGALLAFGGSSSGGPPLGYGNANGAFFALLTLAAVLLRVAVPAMTQPTRLATTTVGVAALGACVSTRSVGAIAALAAGLGVALLAEALRRPWVAIPVATIVLAVALGVTAALASGAGPEQLADDSLGTRVQLWRSAATLTEGHRLTGVGPGRFDAVDGVSADIDLRRAHSLPLQTAAEQGAIGLALLLALVGWAATALWRVGLRPSCAVGAGVLACVGLLACWDWVLAEPAVSITAAVLIGWSSAGQRIPERASASR
jgi:O-antigen ligase